MSFGGRVACFGVAGCVFRCYCVVLVLFLLERVVMRKVPDVTIEKAIWLDGDTAGEFLQFFRLSDDSVEFRIGDCDGERVIRLQCLPAMQFCRAIAENLGGWDVY